MRRISLYWAAVWMVLAAPALVRGQVFGGGFGGYLVFPLLQSDHGETFPLSYGGLAVNPGNTNYLYVVGNAARSGAGIYLAYMNRDSARHITGFLQRGTLLAATPKAGSGLAFLRNGALVHSMESGSGGVDVAVVVPGQKINRHAASLVPDTPGGLQVVPPGFGGGSGQLKILSSNGRMYSSNNYSADFLNQSFNQGGLVATLPQPGEGFAYVRAGSTGFSVDSMLVAEFKTGTVAAYEVDGDGNPLSGTRRTYLSGVNGVVGVTVDPETNDLLLSTRYNSSSVLLRISGFQAPPAPVNVAISSCQEITQSGNYTLTGNLSSGLECIKIHDVRNVHLNCGGRAIQGSPAVFIINTNEFSVRGCGLSNLTLVNSEIGELSNNTIGSLTAPANVQIWKSYGLTISYSAIFGRITMKYVSAWVMHNQITCPTWFNASYGISSSMGDHNWIFDNTIDGQSNPRSSIAVGGQNGIRLEEERETKIENNVIRNVYQAGIMTVGNTEQLTVFSNTIDTVKVGIDSRSWTSWNGVRVQDNTVNNALVMFSFFRANGLRPYNWDAGGAPADTGVYFRQVGFLGNKFTNQWFWYYSIWLPVFDKNLYFQGGGPLPGERAPKDSEIHFEQISFWNNDLLTSAAVPVFGLPIIQGIISDSGGNHCADPGIPDYPLTCLP